MATIKLGNETLTIDTGTMHIHIENATRGDVAHTILCIERNDTDLENKKHIDIELETNYSIYDLCVKARLKNGKSKSDMISVLDKDKMLAF